MIQKIFYNNSKDAILVFFYISLSTTLFTFYYDQTEISYIGKFFAKNNELSAFIGDNSVNILFNFLVGNYFNIFDSYIFYIFLTVFYISIISIVVNLYLNELNYSTSKKLIFISIFFICNQSLYSGSYLISGIQPKSFSYILLISSITFLIKEKFKTSFYLIFIASLFHPSVGLIGVLIFLYPQTIKSTYQEFKNHEKILILISGLAYFYFLLNELVLQNDPILYTSDIQSSEYLVKFRFDHHLIPFDSFENGFFNDLNWKIGFYSLIFILFSLLIVQKYDNFEKPILIKSLNILCITQLFLFFLHYQLEFSKPLLSFPYRSSTIILFLYLSIIIKLISKDILVSLLLVTTSIFYLTNSINTVVKESNINKQKIAFVRDLSNLIPSNQHYSVILTPEYSTYLFWSIEMETGIPQYTSFKHAPLNLDSVPEWNIRLEKKFNFLNDSQCNLFDDYNILYIFDENSHDCGNIIGSLNNGWYLFENLK